MSMACSYNVDDVASCMLSDSRVGTVDVVVSGMKTYRLFEILHVEDCSGSNFHWLGCCTGPPAGDRNSGGGGGVPQADWFFVMILW